METWDLWYPKAAATGLPFARGKMDPTPALLVHAAPDFLTVEVRDDEGRLIAAGRDLQRTVESPMCRLTCEKGNITREDIWPTKGDIGLPVLLPGGEVGILLEWWNDEDFQEWRWRIELYNSLR